MLKFLSLMLLLLGLLLVAGCDDAGLDAELPAADIQLKGFSLASFYDGAYRDAAQTGSLQDLSDQTGTEWVALCVFEFQENVQSSLIGPDFSGVNPLSGRPFLSTSSPTDIRRGIQAARDLNMRIMLKPHVDLYDGSWRGHIQPRDIAAWFASYTQMLTKYAAIAEAEQVEMFCIGVEMVGVTAAENSSAWRALIANIREVYSGQLTYSANWTRAGDGTLPEYRRIEFWPELDYVGVSLYAPLQDAVEEGLPDLNMAKLRLLPIAADLEILSREIGRPFLLTEVGMRSTRGALVSPWSLSAPSPDLVVDEAAQAMYYRAVLESFASRPRCHGFFWWNWPTDVAGAPGTDYGVQGKAAARVLAEWYR